MRYWPPLLCMLIGYALSGCTAVTQVRTLSPAAADASGSKAVLDPPTTDNKAFVDCRTGSPAAGENLRMIEDYGKYLLAFAEFDDQGWSYNHDQQLGVIQDRIAAELANPATRDSDFLVLVFVHGWHHNAHENDCNVQQFRQMVRIAAEGTETARKSGKLVKYRRVIGIYAGWRGEVLDAPLLRYLTVIDRRDTAERVAKGSVRKLFANLHAQQVIAQKLRPDRMRTVVIGHSFGGLVAFSALSQGELNDLTSVSSESPLLCDPADPRHSTLKASPVWPDALVLINPAFEATRFDQFDRLVKARAACLPPEKSTNQLVVPSMIVVTAENDGWTGKMFTIARSISTLSEAYDRTDPEATKKERISNLHAIGFVTAYQTQRLDVDSQQDPPRAIAQLLPATAHTLSVQSPLWVVTASPAVVNGHTGFLYPQPKDKNPRPYLADWLLDLYNKDCDAAPGMVGCDVPPSGK